MFVPPRPWVSHTSGAYFYNRCAIYYPLSWGMTKLITRLLSLNSHSNEDKGLIGTISVPR
jgi:DNA-directed RNA polymerase